MNRKIFDIGSSNNFIEEDRWIWHLGKDEKEVTFPPWLTLPTYYTKELWRKVLSLDGMNTIKMNDMRVGMVLECGHIHYTSRLVIDATRSIKVIYVNCKECGGIGQMHFN